MENVYTHETLKSKNNDQFVNDGPFELSTIGSEPASISSPMISYGNSMKQLPQSQTCGRRLSISTEKKSVTFSIAGSEQATKILNASDCLRYMRKGSEMTKLHSSGRQYKRTFYLNDPMTHINWTTSSNRHQSKSQIPIEDIHEVQVGCSSRTAYTLGRRRPTSITPTLPYGTSGSWSPSPHLGSANYGSSLQLNLSSSTFTICYGPDFSSLEVLAASPDEANIWVTGIKCLMAGAQNPKLLEERTKPRDKWLESVFNQADVLKQGDLNEFDVIRLICSINTNLSVTYLHQKLKETDVRTKKNHRNRITKDEFVNFFKKITTRQEIYYILIRYSGGAEYMAAEDLRNFLESEQGKTGITLEQCKNLIRRFEPYEEHREFNFLGIDGFTALLMSEEGDVFNPAHLQVCQDMSQPITHYYIASSHKTFLLEDQLTGPCSVEGYQRALLSGCRYVEIEIHDGHDGYPVVKRPNSRPPGIPVQAVLNTIHDFAFIRSEFPLIVSIECFASPAQQNILVTFLRCCFGRRLLLPSTEFSFTLSDVQLEIEEQTERHQVFQRKNSLTTVTLTDEATIYTSDGHHVRWPSPRDLMGRILLKGKRLPKGTNYNSITDFNKWMNGNILNSKRSFGISNYAAPAVTTLPIRELSDMFFFDSIMYDGVSPFSALKSPLSSTLTLNTNPSTVGTTNQLLTNITRNTNSNKNSALVIVGTHKTEGKASRSLRYYAGRVSKLAERFNDPNSGTQHQMNQEKLRMHPYHIITMTEADASRAIGFVTTELVQTTRHSFLEVRPSPSRADSSNLNPLDIWAWGGQLVPLNYQTAGLVMDLATGFFARNGACGYVLKPGLYRHPSSFFTPLRPTTSDGMVRHPDTTPQLLRLKIISAQQLPKPRGSVSKGDTIEPYVVVEIHGIPVDCAEQRTVAAPAGNAVGYNAVFENTFEFCVQLGSLALVRFVVLDDHAIGDDFIGQNTIPFDCLLSGYRHVRLRNDTGEPIPLATLFVHITITTQSSIADEEFHNGILHKWRSRGRQYPQLKKVNVSGFDDVFKSAMTTLRQASELRTSLLTSFENFRRLCGETTTPLSMSQCIRSLSSRLSSAFGLPEHWPLRIRIRPEDEMPHIELQNSFTGTSLGGLSSLYTLSDTSSRSSSIRFSPARSLHRSPSLVLSPRLFLPRRLKSSTKSIDEETTSALSIDVGGCNNVRDSSPASTSISRRRSINSSSSSISSLSIGRIDKIKTILVDFEALIEACKTLIKQGPYILVKLQQIQRTALEAYTNFLDAIKSPSASCKTANVQSALSINDGKLGGPWEKQTNGRAASIKTDLLGGASHLNDVDGRVSSAPTGTTLYWKRMSRISDSVTWNLRILTGQVELLTILLSEVNNWIKQARETSLTTGLLVTSSLNKADSCSTNDSLSSPSYSEPNDINDGIGHISNTSKQLNVNTTTTANSIDPSTKISSHFMPSKQYSHSFNDKSLITSNPYTNNDKKTHEIGKNIAPIQGKTITTENNLISNTLFRFKLRSTHTIRK